MELRTVEPVKENQFKDLSLDVPNQGGPLEALTLGFEKKVRFQRIQAQMSQLIDNLKSHV